MKVAVPAEDLNAALSRVMKVVGAIRYQIPITTTLHFEAGERLRITGTDLDTTITVTVPAAKIIASGEACIPAAEIAKLAGYARKSDVAISVDETVKVSFGSTLAELKGLPPEDFPRPGAIGALDPVDGKLFKDALAFAAPAASTEETRFELNGVFLGNDDAGAFAVATDGYRLHLAEMPMARLNGSAIIPSKDIPILTAIAAVDGFLFRMSETGWAARGGDTEARGKAVDGIFPDFRRFAMSEPAGEFVVDSDALLEAVGIAVVGAEKLSRGVIIDAVCGEVRVSSRRLGDKMISSSASVAAEVKSPILQCLNADYLRASIKALNCGQVAIFCASNMPLFRFEPVEPRTEMRMTAMIIGMRASEAELTCGRKHLVAAE